MPINPVYINIFQQLSEYTDIFLLFITAYKKCLFNQTNNLNKKISDIKFNNHCNNKLEELWGKYEHIYLLLIKNFKKINIKNYFEQYHINNLLNNIKNNILNFQKNKPLLKKIFDPQDKSISINICYNKQHEIEVLYKTLINLLNTNKNIKLHDIVITSFELNDYITHINSVFKLYKQEEKIPFYISQKNCKHTKQILYIFNKILNLSQIRFNNQEILEFLDIPIIERKFNFSDKEKNILYNWIESTNIKWGVNTEHKNIFFCLGINQNTWFYGIEKLLLSYATNEKNQVWHNILSVITMDFSQIELIEKLSHLINVLNKWRLKLKQSKKFKSWRSLFKSFSYDFFHEKNEINKTLQTLNNYWENMIDNMLLSKYQKIVSIHLLKKNFLHIIEHQNHSTLKIGFLNFCHPSLICYIPFKIIYIIGLNDQETKKNNTDHFNLLKKYPLITDINTEEKKQHFFLQNFVSATKYLYISYAQYSLKNEHKISPSILIYQLINHINLHFYFKNEKKKHHSDNIKTIFHYLCTKHHRNHLYTIKNIKIKENKQNNKIKKLCQIFFKNIDHIKYLKKINITINLEDLICFWKHPIKYFFNFTLNTKYSIKNTLSITEPFIIDKLSSYKISNILLTHIIHKKNFKNVLKIIKLSGILPYRNLGEIALKNIYQEIKEIANIVNQFRLLPQEKSFNLKINQYYIKGVLKEIQNTGLIRWKSNSINYSDRISLWLEHLVYCILGGIGESKIIGYKKQIFSFKPIPYDIAYNYLEMYIKGYISGIKYPLLLIKSGASWLDKVYDIKNHCIFKQPDIKKEGYKILYHTWIGNEYIKGEKEDIYISKIISKLDVKKICSISQKWLTPLLKYKKVYEKKIKYI